MKFRISLYKDGNDETVYIPEMKYKYWPFWLTFATYIGTLEFKTEEGAVEFICEKESQIRVNTRVLYAYIINPTCKEKK